MNTDGLTERPDMASGLNLCCITRTGRFTYGDDVVVYSADMDLIRFCVRHKLTSMMCPGNDLLKRVWFDYQVRRVVTEKPFHADVKRKICAEVDLDGTPMVRGCPPKIGEIYELELASCMDGSIYLAGMEPPPSHLVVKVVGIVPKGDSLGLVETVVEDGTSRSILSTPVLKLSKTKDRVKRAKIISEYSDFAC